MRNFNNFIEGFMEYTQYVEAPDKFLRWSAISVIAGALERKIWIRFNGVQNVHPNLFILLVGSPGLAKKSSSSSAAVNLLKVNKNIRFMSTQMTAASLITQLVEAGAHRYTEVNGEKYHNSSLYLYSSEAAVTLKEITGSVTELFTDFYDCGPDGWSNDVAWVKTTKMDGDIKIFNPCLNMLACSTPDWLKKIITVDEMKGGFASRILFVVQTGKPERSIGWIENLPDMAGLREKLVQDLHRISLLKGQVSIDSSFIEAFNEFKREHEAVIITQQNDNMIGYYSRKAWHIMKLAQVMMVAEGDDLMLTRKHWDAALTELNKIEPNMKLALGATGENAFAPGLHKLWSYMSTKDTVTKKELLEKFWKDFQPKQLTEYLGTLIEINKVTPHVLPKIGVVYEIVNKDPLM